MSAVLEQSGVRISRKATDYIPASATIRPLRDQLVLEPLDWKVSESVEVVWNEGKMIRGRVLAIGPGTYLTEYQDAQTGLWSCNVPHSRRKASRASKVFRPCDVKDGDIVDIGYYDFPVVLWGSKVVVIAREEDVTGVVSA